MYVVEFQKRGKPHAHITLRFEGEEEEMPKTPKAIDALVSGKLPPTCNCALCSDAIAPPCPVGRRRNAVLKHMMHKCISGVCLPKEGPSVCCRGYPKAPCAETTQDDGGYPIYSWGAGDENVVPHNVALLLRYDSHINVELCTTVWVSKYMHKYMHKGPDSIRLITKDLYANLAASGMNMKDDILKHQVFATCLLVRHSAEPLATTFPKAAWVAPASPCTWRAWIGWGTRGSQPPRPPPLQTTLRAPLSSTTCATYSTFPSTL